MEQQTPEMLSTNTIHEHTYQPSVSCVHGNWRQVGEAVDAYERRGSCSSKQPVAISQNGKRVVIGSAVAVKVCDFDGVRWNETGSFAGSNWGTFSLSGNGKRLVFGDEYKSQVVVYEYKEGIGWNVLGQKLDGFGGWVTISADGNRIAIGSYSKGGIRVFECDRDTKRQLVQEITQEADWCGLIFDFLGINWNQIGQTINEREACTTALSFSADGNAVAVGGYEGFVRVFRYAHQGIGTGDWVQLGQKISGRSPDIMSKLYISINATGDTLAVAASQAHFNSSGGHVKVFQLNNNEWECMGKPLVDKSKDRFGNSICIAPNSNRIAVGPYDERGGYVNIYDYNGKDWVQVGDLTAPSSEVLYGYSLSLSSCGDQVTVGSVHFNGHFCKGRLSIYECR